MICSNLRGYKEGLLCKGIEMFNIVLNIFPFAFLLQIRELSKLTIFYTHSYLYPKRIMIRMVCLQELWLHVEKWHNSCCWISWLDPLSLIGLPIWEKYRPPSGKYVIQNHNYFAIDNVCAQFAFSISQDDLYIFILKRKCLSDNLHYLQSF